MSTMMRRMLGLVMLLSLCVVVRVSADLKGDQFDRFYKRYVGTWKVNVAKSQYMVGEPPKEAPSHTYSAIPGRKAIKFNGDAVHLLDGKDHPLSTKQPGSTVAREVLDEFTVANTLKQDGRVTSRNTFVLSPDGKFAVMVFMNINERGEPSVRSLVYYEKVQ